MKQNTKLLNLIKKQKEDGILIPKNHPDNELTKTEAVKYKKQMEECWKLEKQGLIELSSDDRRCSLFVHKDYFE